MAIRLNEALRASVGSTDARNRARCFGVVGPTRASFQTTKRVTRYLRQRASASVAWMIRDSMEGHRMTVSTRSSA